MKASLLAPLLIGSILPWPFAEDRSVEGFELHGSASALDSGCVQLTPDVRWSSGSAWSRRPLDLGRPFDLSMRLFFGDRDALGADGIVFALTTNGGTGYRGEGLGYAGLRTSLGIELDTYQNRRQNDPTADHLALLINGVPYHRSQAGLVELPNLEDGKQHAFRVTWAPDESELKVYLDGKHLATYPGWVVRRLFGSKASVSWGLTAATGRKTNAHVVCFDAD